MKKYIWACVLAAWTLAVPAQAQNYTGIFSESGDRVAAKLAKISFPKKVGDFTLKSTAEFSRQGESLDSAAQYDGPNGVHVTVYIYRPGYADAALAAYETDKIMPQVYGAGIKRTSQTMAPFGGRANAAIRMALPEGP